MTKSAKRNQVRKELKKYAEQWIDELLDWNAVRPDATLSEIENHARLKRRELMSRVLTVMLTQHGAGYVVEGIQCPKCGQLMRYKGTPGATFETREAAARIERAYYHCPSCKEGFFPPGSTSKNEGRDVE